MQFHNRCIIFATRSRNVGRKSEKWLIIRTNETSIEIEIRSNLTTLFMPSIRFIRRSQISWSYNQTRFKMQLKHWTLIFRLLFYIHVPCMIRLSSLHLSSILYQFKLYNMSQTLDAFRCLF
jgi:hypothetical protein